jgi:hypothetical protein
LAPTNSQLFAKTPVIEISDALKLRAAQRAIDQRAPFHRQRNGIDDTILIEVYADAAGARKPAGRRKLFHRGRSATAAIASVRFNVSSSMSILLSDDFFHI